jgi:hypothetical protein
MLPAKPVSAVDTVGPAIEWTKRAMFRPFQWAKWWRVALVGMIAGELQSFSCSGGRGYGAEAPGGGSPFPSIDPAVIASIIAVLIVGGVVLVLVHMYLASVCRFILFDAVTTGRYRLREGWSRWHDRGIRWFGFNLAFAFVVGLIGLLFLIPFIGTIIAAKKAGIGAMLGAVLVLVPVFLLLALVVGLFYVLAKDFAVPMVALENEGVFSAFGRVLGMARANLGDFAGYIGLKIVLAIAYGICFTIATVIIVVIASIPIVGIAVAAGLTMPSLLHNPVNLAIAITIIVIFFFALMFLIACLFAPAIFFFQAYVYTWYAQRYEPLWNLLYPPAPTPPPAVAPVAAPPEPPPLPAV